MKLFLSLSLFGMISAGIYGFADMAHDVANGTMIRYDEGRSAHVKPDPRMFAVFRKFYHDHNFAIVIPQLRTVAKQEKKKKAEASHDIDYSDFSRAEPVGYELMDPIQLDSSFVAKTDTLSPATFTPHPADTTVIIHYSDSTGTVSNGGL